MCVLMYDDTRNLCVMIHATATPGTLDSGVFGVQSTSYILHIRIEFTGIIDVPHLQLNDSRTMLLSLTLTRMPSHVSSPPLLH